MSVWSVLLIPLIVAGALVVFSLLAYSLLASAVNATINWFRG